MNNIGRLMKAKNMSEQESNATSTKNKTSELDYAHKKRELPKEVRNKIFEFKRKYELVKEETIYNLIKKHEFNYNLVDQDLKFLSITKRSVPAHHISQNKHLEKNPNITRKSVNTNPIANSREIQRSLNKGPEPKKSVSLNKSDLGIRFKSTEFRYANQPHIQSQEDNTIKAYKASSKDYKVAEYPIKNSAKLHQNSPKATREGNNFFVARKTDPVSHKNGYKFSSKDGANENPRLYKTNNLNFRAAVEDVKLSNIILERFGNDEESCEITLQKQDPVYTQNLELHSVSIDPEQVSRALRLITRKLRTQVVYCLKTLRANAKKNRKTKVDQSDNLLEDVSAPVKKDDARMRPNADADQKFRNSNNEFINGSRTQMIDMMLKDKLEPDDKKHQISREKELEMKIDELNDVINRMQITIGELNQALVEKDRQLELSKLASSVNPHPSGPFYNNAGQIQPLDVVIHSVSMNQSPSLQTENK